MRNCKHSEVITIDIPLHELVAWLKLRGDMPLDWTVNDQYGSVFQVRLEKEIAGTEEEPT